jgi:hypothetical protein
MIAAQLGAVALIVMAAMGPGLERDTAQQLSGQQKRVALQTLVHRATECLARTVAAEVRISSNADLSDLIVASVPACLDSVRALIHGYDRYYGDGAGEAFFMGPYLDVLPAAINNWVNRPGP